MTTFPSEPKYLYHLGRIHTCRVVNISLEWSRLFLLYSNVVPVEILIWPSKSYTSLSSWVNSSLPQGKLYYFLFLIYYSFYLQTYSNNLKLTMHINYKGKVLVCETSVWCMVKPAVNIYWVELFLNISTDSPLHSYLCYSVDQST